MVQTSKVTINEVAYALLIGAKVDDLVLL